MKRVLGLIPLAIFWGRIDIGCSEKQMIELPIVDTPGLFGKANPFVVTILFPAITIGS